ncbi:MAG: MarR family winged helix-turn-helix transcriptional regulator [Victivallales bacterium]|nr:MarR family winged helix-turn-helix transcriptional regulator [Victivallales bacterium]
MSDRSVIEKIRQFTRFYAHFFGLYNNNFLESKFSLTEARVIFELGRNKKNTAKELAENLKIDPGYLSRIIKSFEKEGYLIRKQCTKDARKHYLQLTSSGRKIRAKLDKSTNLQIENILEDLSEETKRILCNKMNEIEFILKNKIDEEYDRRL